MTNSLTIDITIQNFSRMYIPTNFINQLKVKSNCPNFMHFKFREPQLTISFTIDITNSQMSHGFCWKKGCKLPTFKFITSPISMWDLFSFENLSFYKHKTHLLHVNWDDGAGAAGRWLRPPGAHGALPGAGSSRNEARHFIWNNYSNYKTSNASRL